MLLLWMSCSLTLICSFDSKLQLGRLYLVLIVCQLYGGGERNNDEVCQRVLYWCCDIDICFIGRQWQMKIPQQIVILIDDVK